MSAKQDIYRPLKRRAFNLLQSISTCARSQRAPNKGFLGQTQGICKRSKYQQLQESRLIWPEVACCTKGKLLKWCTRHWHCLYMHAWEIQNHVSQAGHL